MKISNVKSEQAAKIFLYACPLVTYVVALYGGLWWLNNEVAWSGLIFLCGLYVFSYEVGYKNYYRASQKYFNLTFLLPSVVATILFLIGFL